MGKVNFMLFFFNHLRGALKAFGDGFAPGLDAQFFTAFFMGGFPETLGGFPLGFFLHNALIKLAAPLLLKSMKLFSG